MTSLILAAKPECPSSAHLDSRWHGRNSAQVLFPKITGADFVIAVGQSKSDSPSRMVDLPAGTGGENHIYSVVRQSMFSLRCRRISPAAVHMR